MPGKSRGIVVFAKTAQEIVGVGGADWLLSRAGTPEKLGRIGDEDHVRIFANDEAAEKWFSENEAEGGAFEYQAIGSLRCRRFQN